MGVKAVPPFLLCHSGSVRFMAGPEDAGERLDRFLAGRLQGPSRSLVLVWIRAGRVQVGGLVERRGGRRLCGGESVEVEPAERAPLGAKPEDIAVDILYEDDHLAVVDKPSGMAVHAGAGCASGTLVNALMYRLGSLSGVSGHLRPGIVHRLDRFTTGVMVVAKEDRVHQLLQEQFQRREVKKLYWAVVEGRWPTVPQEDARGLRQGRPVMRNGTWWLRLEMPIRRDKRNRVKMAAARTGRQAVSDVRALKTGPRHALIEVRIHTGRTHQVRVHLSSVGHPVVGDTLYGARGSGDVPVGCRRYLLHARSLAFRHPVSGEQMVFEAPLPPDFGSSLESLGI